MFILRLFVPTKDRSGLDLDPQMQLDLRKGATNLVHELGGSGGTIFTGEGFWFGENTVFETVHIVETFLEGDVTPAITERVTRWAEIVARASDQEAVLFTITVPTSQQNFFVSGE